MVSIVLDPGHGGETKVGGSSANNAEGPNGTLEKHVNLAVAQLLGQILDVRGYDVRFTRVGDENLGLADRASVAKEAAAEAFVSVHFNASEEERAGQAQGTETLIHINHSTQASVRLASCVQNTLVVALGYRDRGTKRKALGVINSTHHHAQTAAVLVESSFMDRADEEALLNTAAHRQTIADAIAAGIELYLSDPNEWGPHRYEPVPVKSLLNSVRRFFGRKPEDTDI